MWVWMIIDHIEIMTEYILRTPIMRHNMRTGATWYQHSQPSYHMQGEQPEVDKYASLSRVLVRFESTLWQGR